MRIGKDEDTIEINLKKQLLLIVISSAVISIIYGLVEGTFSVGGIPRFLIGITPTLLIWSGCSVIVGKLWKKYPWEQMPVKHLVIEVVLIIIYSNLIVLLWAFVIRPLMLNPIHVGRKEYFMTNFLTLFITTLHEAYFFYRQWQMNFSKSVRLERDNLEARFEILKAQLNPHFLFNSLNSLTAMLEDNPEAERYVQDLSYFMRYILKNRDNELIHLREEMDMIQKYISLQKVRFEENLNVEIQVEEGYQHHSLPPLSLQILLENCIKHNIITSSKPLTIKIGTEDAWLTVSNNLQVKQNVSSSGQGLRNIIERYSFYTSEKVEIINDDVNFIVRIPLIRTQT